MFNFSPIVRTLWVFIPILLPVSQAICAPQYSEANAEITAKAFCQKLAIPVETSSNVKQNLDGATPGSINSEFMAPDQVHLHSRWKIQFPTQVEITVSGVNGQIEGYSNQQFYYRHDLSPSGPAIPREEALQRAMSLLKAAGTPVSELTLIEADDVQVSAGSRGHRWSLHWRRNYQGIPYAYQNVFVDLVAETGEVIRAAIGLDLLPPTSIAENVTQEEAINIGQAQLLAAGIQGYTSSWTHKMIVQPDTSGRMAIYGHGDFHPNCLVVWFRFRQYDLCCLG